MKYLDGAVFDFVYLTAQTITWKIRTSGHTVRVFGVTPAAPPDHGPQPFFHTFLPWTSSTIAGFTQTIVPILSRYNSYCLPFVSFPQRESIVRLHPNYHLHSNSVRAHIAVSSKIPDNSQDNRTEYTTMSDEQPKEQTNGTNDNNGVEQTNQEEQVKEDDR